VAIKQFKRMNQKVACFLSFSLLLGEGSSRRMLYHLQIIFYFLFFLEQSPWLYVGMTALLTILLRINFYFYVMVQLTSKGKVHCLSVSP
jgi:hypothetical protein